MPQVKLGQKASMSIDAYPNRKFEGTVTEVGSSPIPKTDPDLLALVANSEAINFKVKIRIDNPPDTIRPGFSVTADIVTGRRDNATAIPIQALVVRDVPKKDKAPAQGRSETEEGVYTIKDGKLEFVKVKTGIAGELMIESLEGPKPGQEIVTGPFKVLRQVKEGDKVLIEKEGGSDKGEPKRT
jgi:HlyD family secretion protein